MNLTRDDKSSEVERPSIIEGINARIIEDSSLYEKQQEYLRNRWLHEVSWFARATRRSRRTYYLLGLVSVSAAAFIAFCAALGVSVAATEIRWLTSFLSLLTAISTGLFAIFKPWSNWKRRCMTLERLKSEGRMFWIKADRYKEISDPKQAFRILAERIEQIVA